MDMKQEVIW